MQPTPPTYSPLLLRALSILVTLLVPVVLALIGVRLLMTETYLSLEYNKPDFPPDVYGFTLQDRLHYAPYAVQYLTNNAGIEYLGVLTQPNGQRFYNDRELSHMVDVKRVTQFAFGALGVGILILAVFSAMLIRWPEGRRALRQGLFGGGLLMLAILVGLVLLVVLNWDTFFDDFHELFFAAGTWRFEWSDSLIRLFPIHFWQDAALTIGGIGAVGALLLMAGAWWWSRRDSRHNV